MGAVVDGPAAAWLEARRDSLNERFERARRRTPALDGGEVLLRLSSALPGLAGPEPGAARLCDVVFDLVLLHAGRGAFARIPALATLLDETFPRLRPLLLSAPDTLPAALSNAVENLGAAGDAWLAALPEVVDSLGATPDPKQIRTAGAVLAWRLGEPRLRQRALALARELPEPTVRLALRLPEGADVPGVVERLTVDAWSDPLAPRVSGWTKVRDLGGFSGFGGAFDAPPRVLDGGDPHLLHVESAGRWFRVTADRYGEHAQPEPDPGLGARTPQKPGFFAGLLGTSKEYASPEGTFQLPDGAVTLPGEAGLDTWTRRGSALFTARRDSHFVRVYVKGAA